MTLRPGERARATAVAIILSVWVSHPASAQAKDDGDRYRPSRRSPVVRVVEKAGPAVVNVSTRMARQNPFFRGRGGGGDFWQRFFGSPTPEPDAQSLGSGVIIDADDGLVITNEHVVARAGNITVTLEDRRTFEAVVIGADREFDLAVLRIREGRSLPEVKMGRSDDLMPGEIVVAIGNPFGLSNSVTTGVVSALHRSIDAGDRLYEDFIQTDAAINPGNSGGALLNVHGELIGINTAIYSEGNGIGFAIPVNKARAVVKEVLRYGEVRPVYSGIQVDPRSRPGARVVSVRAESPAWRAGVRPGDVIVDVSGQEVTSGAAYRRLERSFVPGQQVRLTLRGRSESQGHREVVMDVRQLEPRLAVTLGRERLGFGVTEQRGRLRIVAVDPGGPADQAGLRPGDFLLGAFGQRIRTESQFRALCRAVIHEPTIPLVIGRSGRAYYVNLEP